MPIQSGEKPIRDIRVGEDKIDKVMHKGDRLWSRSVEFVSHEFEESSVENTSSEFELKNKHDIPRKGKDVVLVVFWCAYAKSSKVDHGLEVNGVDFEHESNAHRGMDFGFTASTDHTFFGMYVLQGAKGSGEAEIKLKVKSKNSDEVSRSMFHSAVYESAYRKLDDDDELLSTKADDKTAGVGVSTLLDNEDIDISDGDIVVVGCAKEESDEPEFKKFEDSYSERADRCLFGHASGKHDGSSDINIGFDESKYGAMFAVLRP